MHIFVADEPSGGVSCARAAVPYRFRPRRLSRPSVWLEKGGGGERAQMAGVLPFLEGPPSRGQLMNRAATISDRSAAFDGFGRRRGPPNYVTNIEGERLCDHVSPF